MPSPNRYIDNCNITSLLTFQITPSDRNRGNCPTNPKNSFSYSPHISPLTVLPPNFYFKISPSGWPNLGNPGIWYQLQPNHIILNTTDPDQSKLETHFWVLFEQLTGQLRFFSLLNCFKVKLLQLLLWHYAVKNAL